MGTGALLVKGPSKLGLVPDAENDEWWTVQDVAAFLEVSPHTVSSYRSRGQMPAPERHYARTPLWRAETIRTWQEQRPGSGRWGQRPTPSS